MIVIDTVDRTVCGTHVHVPAPPLDLWPPGSWPTILLPIR